VRLSFIAGMRNLTILAVNKMPMIIFYEKPGCINNTKQKKILKSAGYSLVEKNILNEPWNPEDLRKYFGDLPMEQWFNQSAPAIKSNELKLEALNETDALMLMVNDPILIRRPLMSLGDKHKVGFDIAILDELKGIAEKYKQQDLESCPRTVH